MNKYLIKYPHHKYALESNSGIALLKILESRFAYPFDNYWEQFGYRIGGPVCYGFTKWILNEVTSKKENISDIIFVARDGYLLQKILELLPHSGKIKSHYVYAPRILISKLKNLDLRNNYKEYIANLFIGKGAVAVVDTVTLNFSSMKLIAMNIPNKIYGLFWTKLRSLQQNVFNFTYSTFQKEDYHKIYCWNLIEFILTSPEPPLSDWNGNTPIFQKVDYYESERKKIFLQIENGVLNFVQDVLKIDSELEFTNDFITKWVNSFLKRPNNADISAFKNIMFSELEDHSDIIPLDPFEKIGSRFLLKKIKDRLWLFSQRHPFLYFVLHKGKSLYTFLRK